MPRRPNSKTKPPRSLTRVRALEVARLRTRVLGGGFPRLEMLVVVAITALAGWLASHALLAAGLRLMGVRYAMAVVLAYLVFLGLLRLWARLHIDPEAPGPAGSQRAGSDGPATATTAIAIDMEEDVGEAAIDGAFDVIGAAIEAEPDASDLLQVPVAAAVALLMTVMLAIGAVFVGVVAAAPTLLAEVILDLLLAAGLYRRLRRNPGRWWMATAVRHTWLPFALALVFVAIAGAVLQGLVPEAATLGEAFAELRR